MRKTTKKLKERKTDRNMTYLYRGRSKNEQVTECPLLYIVFYKRVNERINFSHFFFHRLKELFSIAFKSFFFLLNELYQ